MVKVNINQPTTSSCQLETIVTHFETEMFNFLNYQTLQLRYKINTDGSVEIETYDHYFIKIGTEHGNFTQFGCQMHITENQSDSNDNDNTESFHVKHILYKSESNEYVIDLLDGKNETLLATAKVTINPAVGYPKKPSKP